MLLRDIKDMKLIEIEQPLVLKEEQKESMVALRFLTWRTKEVEELPAY